MKLLLAWTLLLAAAAAPEVKLGPNGSLAGRPIFAPDSAWNTDIRHLPVDPSSDAYLASIGADAPLHPDFGPSYRGRPYGIPYLVVPGGTPRVPVLFQYAAESDRVLYPIPPDPPIEGGDESDGDRHLVIVDRDSWTLYELFGARRKGQVWTAGAGAVWDMTRNHVRTEGWTSADAAGLPILPGLIRYDEVAEQKEIRHALRFTARKTRRGYVWPASHFASRETSESLPPMGARVRLKAGVNISSFPPGAQVILQAMKRYGMILADNGGNWFLSGTADKRWNEAELQSLGRIKGKDFEFVLTGSVVAP
jgi:hypothetical protein